MGIVFKDGREGAGGSKFVGVGFESSVPGLDGVIEAALLAADWVFVDGREVDEEEVAGTDIV